MQLKIGFMQGRLSPLVNNQIQSFPLGNWEKEFPIANSCGLNKMEWTLDQNKLYENPIMSVHGRKLIKKLSKKHRISIPSLTGDCFMQAPFFKYNGKDQDILLKDMENIIIACGQLNMKIIVFPLVDNGKIESIKQEKLFINRLLNFEKLLEKYQMKIAFESELSPNQLSSFINNFPSEFYGINYDIGNSASYGFNPVEEINSYGDRIINVHIKDRLLGGMTVPLGTGNADIPKVLKTLNSFNYNQNYILQTARADNEDHVGVLCKYFNQVISWSELI